MCDLIPIRGQFINGFSLVVVRLLKSIGRGIIVAKPKENNFESFVGQWLASGSGIVRCGDDLFGEVWAIGSKSRPIRIYKWRMEQFWPSGDFRPFFYLSNIPPSPSIPKIY